MRDDLMPLSECEVASKIYFSKNPDPLLIYLSTSPTGLRKQKDENAYIDGSTLVVPIRDRLIHRVRTAVEIIMEEDSNSLGSSIDYVNLYPHTMNISLEPVSKRPKLNKIADNKSILAVVGD